MQVFRPNTSVYLTSIGIAGCILLAILFFHLLSALYAGCLVYLLVSIFTPFIERHTRVKHSRLIAIGLIAFAVVSSLSLLVFGAWVFLNSDSGNLTALLQKVSSVIATLNSSLPNWISNSLPTNISELQTSLSSLINEHVAELKKIGLDMVINFIHIFIGMVIGALIALHRSTRTHIPLPLHMSLLQRTGLFALAFERVVLAQIKISAINTAFTAVYLMIVLPSFSVHLPFVKTMVVVTFLVGFIPVLGNLISNFIIVVISLSYMPTVGFASLVFLVLIHKLEYFLNAKIVGRQVNAAAWELLIVMILMEAVFGVPGLIAAPVYYAYIKSELVCRSLV